MVLRIALALLANQGERLLARGHPSRSPSRGAPPYPAVSEPIGRLVLVDAATGDIARVLLHDVDYSEGGIWSPDLAPDGRTLYYAMGTSACTDDVRRLPLDDGDEEVLATGQARGPAVSPDGRLLAYLYGDFCVGKTQYVVVRELASGHETRWRFRLGTSGAEGVSLRRLVWLPDSHTLAYEVRREEASWIHLLDTEGDEGIELGEGPPLGPQDSSLELVGFHAEGLAAVRRCFIPPEPGCPPGARDRCSRSGDRRGRRDAPQARPRGVLLRPRSIRSAPPLRHRGGTLPLERRGTCEDRGPVLRSNLVTRPVRPLTLHQYLRHARSSATPLRLEAPPILRRVVRRRLRPRPAR